MKHTLITALIILACSVSRAQPPDTLRIDNYTLVMDAYAYIDMMPSVGERKNNMIVVVWIRSLEPKRLDLFQPIGVYIHYKHLVFLTSHEMLKLRPGDIEYAVRRPPIAPPGAYINIELEVQYKNNRYSIGVPCVRIEKAY